MVNIEAGDEGVFMSPFSGDRNPLTSPLPPDVEKGRESTGSVQPAAIEMSKSATNESRSASKFADAACSAWFAIPVEA